RPPAQYGLSVSELVHPDRDPLPVGPGGVVRHIARTGRCRRAVGGRLHAAKLHAEPAAAGAVYLSRTGHLPLDDRALYAHRYSRRHPQSRHRMFENDRINPVFPSCEIPAWVGEMDRLAAARHPFLFVLDFLLESPMVIPLDALPGTGIRTSLVPDGHDDGAMS